MVWRILFLGVIFSLQSCWSSNSDDQAVSSSDSVFYQTIVVEDKNVAFVNRGDLAKVRLTFDVKKKTDVYFVFTNTSKTSVVKSQNYSVKSNDIDFNVVGDSVAARFGSQNRKTGLKKKTKLTKKSAKSKVFSVSKQDTLSERALFKDVSVLPATKIPAHCRKKVSVPTKFGKKSVNIWVADDCWQKTGKKKRLVNQAMVDAVADKFLKTGEDNDIYDWVTNICGEEWGDRDKNELIAAEQPIDILLCDIGNDDDAKGKLGFFWRGNSYKKKRVPNSNERLLLYLDAPIYAIGDGRNWSVDDSLPRLSISRLAYDFQHMINSYQLFEKKGVYQENWLKSLLSMSVEDLVAQKLFGDFSSSPYNNRFEKLNNCNDYSVGSWGEDLEASYAIHYGLGSYLLRQFGGADFVKKIYASKKKSFDAVEEVTGESFANLMKKWGAAYLLSDIDGSSGEFCYNLDLESSANGVDYNLCEINAFDKGSPRVYAVNSASDISANSNKYFKIKERLPVGKYVIDVLMLDKNLELTVVAK